MPHPPLTDVEARVLGALVEKEATTPDVYPLSLAGLVAACNQTTNRDPVMRLSEDEVASAAVTLRRRGWLRQIQPAGSRVAKYEHLLHEALDLDPSRLAVLGVLLLRGAQTPGELHARTARLAEFADLVAIEAALDALIAHAPEPLAARLPRRPGQKELRYAHLLGELPAAGDADVPNASAADDGRAAALERRVDALEAELAALRATVAELRAVLE